MAAHRLRLPPAPALRHRHKQWSAREGYPIDPTLYEQRVWQREDLCQWLDSESGQAHADATSTVAWHRVCLFDAPEPRRVVEGIELAPRSDRGTFDWLREPVAQLVESEASYPADGLSRHCRMRRMWSWPRVPSNFPNACVLSGMLPPRMVQMHSSSYRNLASCRPVGASGWERRYRLPNHRGAI